MKECWGTGKGEEKRVEGENSAGLSKKKEPGR
jgi:hypothetical protein